MKLRDAKNLFDQLRKDAWRIVPTFHVMHDHLERKFTAGVVIGLIQGSGRLADNKMPSAAAGSFMWVCRDESDVLCELIVKFEPLDGNPNELILVISAYREVKR